MLEYTCDGPDCEERICVGDKALEDWIVVKYLRKDSCEFHYCCWNCLKEDAELEVGVLEKAGRNFARFIRSFFRPRHSDEEEEE